MINRRTLFVVGASSLLAAGLAAQDTYDGAYVYRSNGDLQIQRASDPTPESATINTPVLAGDRVWTGPDSYAEVRFASATVIRLGPETKVDFMTLGNEPTLRLWNGSVVLVPAVGATGTRIDTPSGSFYPQSAGEFRLDVVDGADTYLRVTDGIAELASEHGSVLVHAGERSVVLAGGAPEAPAPVDPSSSDELDRYGSSQVAAASRGGRAPASEVPEEVHHYVDELSEHGSWRDHDDHGSVWYPSVSSNWRPYRDGRWSYTRYGHTWVSYEPWGWAPYHYGRWGYDPYGWYWIPGRRFAPAWVSFAVGPSWIAWSPLGYHGGAVFGYGSYYYGDRYRNSHYYRNTRYGYRPGRRYRGGKAVPRHVYDDGAGWSFQEKQHFGNRERGRLRPSDVRASAAQAVVRNDSAVLDRNFAVRRTAAGATASAGKARRRASAVPFDERRVGRTSIRRSAETLRAPRSSASRPTTRRRAAPLAGTAARAAARRGESSSATIPRATGRRTPALGLGSSRVIDAPRAGRARGNSNATRPSRTQGAPPRATARGRSRTTGQNESRAGARTRRFDAGRPSSSTSETRARPNPPRRRQGVARRTPGVRSAPAPARIPRATTRAPRTRSSRPSVGARGRSSGPARAPRATPPRSPRSGARSVGPTRRAPSPSNRGRTGGAARSRGQRNRNRSNDSSS